MPKLCLVMHTFIIKDMGKNFDSIFNFRLQCLSSYSRLRPSIVNIEKDDQTHFGKRRKKKRIIIGYGKS